MRMPQFLSQHQVDFETLIHPPAYCAQKRAKYLHVPGKQVTKAVLLAGPEDFVLAVLPATHYVDTDALATRLGGPVRLANHREITETFRDCEEGVVPPFGPLYGLPTIIDESLNPDAILVFEGHTHGDAIRLRCRDFERLVMPIRLPFARASTRIASATQAMP